MSKKQRNVLIISLVMILIGSFLANYFNTGKRSVDVERIYFDTDRGSLSGLLYKPKDASDSSPRPTLVTTHGYLNSAEMQDAPSIEMSRRGYVVLALDQYDHGHSKGNAENTGTFMNFWPMSIYDATEYMYDKDYVLKDSDKNGIIAVSGHSMGGFSTTMAVMTDQEQFKETGRKMILAQLSAGSDHTWQNIMGIDTPTIVESMDDRYIGKIAGQFDEFFFNNEDQAGSVVKKSYVDTEEGKLILEEENPQSDTWYDSKANGKRIIYQPYQTHPWNHFSKATTKNMLDFYDVAFSDYKDNIKDISSDNQIWMYKEGSEFIALIGFFIFIVNLAGILSDLNVFKKVKTIKDDKVLVIENSLESVFKDKLVYVLSMLIPAVIFSPVYEGNLSSNGMVTLNYLSIVMFIFAIVGLVMNKDYNKASWKKGSYTVLVSSIVLFVLTKFTVFKDSPIFQGPTVNRIITWALICAMISIFINTYTNLLNDKYDFENRKYHYGLEGSASTILTSLLVALIVSAISYLVLFIIDRTFLVDFRIWTLAFKTFEFSHLIAALKYMPLFFIYYLVAGSGSVASSNGKSGLKAYLSAVLINVGGIAIWLVLQYAKLFITGVAMYPNDSLSGILLIALVPTLVFAFINTKYLYNKNNNIYLPAFLNSILLTIMTVANTAIYFQ